MALDGSSFRHADTLALHASLILDREAPAVAPDLRAERLDVREDTASRRLVEAASRALEAAPSLESEREGVALWQALLEGQWSVVESADADGKRMLILRRGGVDVARRLTEEERRTLELVRMGHANKWLAIELGLAESTVSQRVAKALAKLRFRSRIEFVRFCGADLQGSMTIGCSV